MIIECYRSKKESIMKSFYNRLKGKGLLFSYLCRVFTAGMEMLFMGTLSYCWSSGMLSWPQIEVLREGQTVETPIFFVLIGICTIVLLWKEYKKGQLFYAKEIAEVCIAGVWVTVHATGAMSTPAGLHADIAFYGLILGLNLMALLSLIRKQVS